MTDYAVTVVWDVALDDVECPPDLCATLVSHEGRLATAVYVSADSAPEAQEAAIDRVSGYMAWSVTPVAVAVEPTSVMPHFVLGAMGR